MILIEETQNFLTIKCRNCDGDTIDEIETILNDLNIGIDGIRSGEFVGNIYNSDDPFPRTKEYKIDGLTNDWKLLLELAISESKGIKGELLFKKPDPMKSIVDNVNLNLNTLRGKLEKDL